jgi:OOP family OmpA-OmpF porin
VDNDLERVRRALLGDDYHQLLELKEEYHDDGQFVVHLSSVIAEALKDSAEKDDSVAKVLSPMMDQAIAGSINRDPHKLAETLYPIMGPAIRKSITETLQQMLENFNQLLEQSLSPRALRWRFDAWRTGRSYSELVLLNSLEYQVEQIFLIHRETSLLIQHVTDDMAVTRDADMVSSMLSAIQDFIADSFSVSDDDSLDTLRLGDLTVVISRGPLAVAAAVVRGTVPERLRDQLAEILENLHRLHQSALTEYQGDSAEFAAVHEDLEGVLQTKLIEEQGRRFPWFGLAGVLIIIGTVSWFSYQESIEAAAFRESVTRLEEEPGMVVLSRAETADTYNVTLLLDPGARPPAQVMQAERLDKPVDFVTHTYLSTEDTLVAARAQAVLPLPDGVTLRVENGVLSLRGTATTDWKSDFDQRWPFVVGLQKLDTTALSIFDPVADTIANLITEIESVEFNFSPAEATIEDQATLSRLVVAILEVNKLRAGRNEDSVKLDIVGYTDETGTMDTNRRIGLERAESLKRLLVDSGINAGDISTFSNLEYLTASAEAVRKTRVIVHRD